MTGKVESEEHFLLDCYGYNNIREAMYTKIKEQTGYDFLLLKEDKSWLLDALIGHGLQKKDVRESRESGDEVHSSSHEDQKTRHQWSAIAMHQKRSG